jgi:hypothetical protein
VCWYLYGHCSGPQKYHNAIITYAMWTCRRCLADGKPETPCSILDCMCRPYHHHQETDVYTLIFDSRQGPSTPR